MGNYVLDETYLISYTYSDGWTERMLTISFFVDLYFDCKINLCFYECRSNQKKATSNFEKKEFQIQLATPAKLKNLIQNLMQLDKINLKFSYSDLFLEDSKDEFFVINHKEKSHYSSMGILTKEIKPTNASEELFFQIHSLFFEWKEEIYKTIKTET